jgi:transcriptional regulator with XRE-family HTH domain
MNERIKKIIDEKGLTVSIFANETGINQATISFILNGRKDKNGNRTVQEPSRAVLAKILETYPDINPAWLHYGTGPMYKSDKPIMVAAPESPDLFSQNAVNPLNDTVEPKYRKEIIDKSAEIPPQNSKKQSIMPEFPISDNIDKIVIFFKNKTYITLKPEE